MIVAVYGHTDKRPVIYTLMKLFQKLGDTCLVSDDRHYRRLLQDGEMSGHYQNIFLAITDASPDEVFAEMGYDVQDFENMIFDNTIPNDADVIIFVEGIEVTEEEKETLDYLDNYVTIGFGYGKNSVPYTVDIFKNIEIVEGKKMLKEIDKKMTKKIATALSKNLNMPVANICKVAAKR